MLVFNTHMQTHGNFGGDGSIYHLNTLVMFSLGNAYVQIKLCSLNMCDFSVHKMYLDKVVKKNNGMLSQSMSFLFSFPIHFSQSCQRTIIKCKLWRRKWQPLQYSCLGNPMDRGAYQNTIHGVAEELEMN